MDIRRPNFFLVCGISGGGKTVLSNKIIEKNPDLVIMDVDEYYAKRNGDECDRSNWFDVWVKMIYVDLHEYELAGKDVLLTTNALTVSQRRQFIEFFPTFMHHCLWVTSPKERCLEGNKVRRRHVPDDQMEKQWQRMEFPNANEAGWDSICQVTNCWDNENYIFFDLKGNVREILNI